MQSMWWPNCIIWYSSTNRGVTICICKFEMFKFSIVSYKLPFHFWNIGIWKRNGSRAELANHWSFLFELHWSFQFLTIDCTDQTAILPLYLWHEFVSDYNQSVKQNLLQNALRVGCRCSCWWLFVLLAFKHTPNWVHFSENLCVDKFNLGNLFIN